MKKLILLLCMFTSIVQAQTLMNQKDPFTGIQTKAATVLFGSTITIGSIGMQLMFIQSDSTKLIGFMWTGASGNFGAFNGQKAENSSLLFKMDNDTILKFKADSTTSKISNAGNNSMMMISSKISNEQLKALTEHQISIFRLGVKDDLGVDIDKHLFTDRNKKQVMKAAAYMLEN